MKFLFFYFNYFYVFVFLYRVCFGDLEFMKGVYNCYLFFNCFFNLYGVFFIIVYIYC